jgi:hypothetical protein
MKLVLRDSTGFVAIAILSFVSLTAGCKSKSSQPEPKSQNTTQGVTLPPTQQSSVDDLVAPIALYPDQLLAQVLAIAVNPQEVLDLGNWLLQNQNLQGDAMSNAAKQAGFGPSAQYLAHFPQVVDNMCQQMDWTRQIGEAFKADQKSVMDAVQRKRTQAQQIGNLKSSPQMAVENKKADNGQSYVEIQPADPKVVYVPQYNPVTIYNTPPPAAPAQTTTTTTTSEKESGVSGGEAAAIGLLSFGVGMALGAAINNDYYHYPYPAWGYSSVYVARGPYYPAAYRAPAYAGYRPAYGYNPPGNYRWNQYNRNNNVNINNNYYNRFNTSNANTRAANARQTYTNQNRAGNARSVQNQPNWKGQSTYQGARSANTQGQRPGTSMANAVPRSEQYGQRSQAAAERANARGADAAANRANAGSVGASNWAANREARTGDVGSMNRSNASAAARQPTQTSFERGGDRGYSAASSRSADSSSFSDRSSSASSRAQSASSGGAFGGGGSGGQERMASSRGRSSMGASSRGGGGRRR